MATQAESSHMRLCDHDVDYYVVTERSEEGPCYWCGGPIDIGDVCYWDVGGTGDYFCSTSCLRKAQPRGET
jgi:hypothetical protein